MSEQEKKQQRIYDLLNAKTKPKIISKIIRVCLQRKIFSEKELFKENRSGRLNKKWKVGFLIALTTAIKKDLTMSIRKHANELKVHK